jgi:acyl carrier protein
MKYLPRIKAFFEKAIGPEAAAAVVETADIESVPGWDSQSFLPLIIAMEDEFGIEIATMDAAALFSVEAIHAYLEERLR